MGAQPAMTEAARAAEHAARASRTRLVSILAASHGDLALAEDAVATAFERALNTWPRAGVPADPDAWLLTVARNSQRDVWKSAAYRTSRPLHDAVQAGADAVNPFVDVDPDEIPDRRLALLFTCAHPAINPEVRAPLMLQAVLGFPAASIAAALALPTSTLTKRLTRAKQRIRDTRIPFTIPDRAQLSGRLPFVLEAIYGCFAIAWAHHDLAAGTASMATEARHLAVTLASLLGSEPEAWGLASLVSFSLARSSAQHGPYIPIEDQDPASWDADLIREAETMLRRASRAGVVGRFQLEAAMHAVHAERRRSRSTDWSALLVLSTALVRTAPTLGARIAHAAIVTRTSGPDAGVELLGEIRARHAEVERIQAFHATLADALLRAGDTHRGHRALTRAIDLSDDPRVRTWLHQRGATLGGPPGRSVHVADNGSRPLR